MDLLSTKSLASSFSCFARHRPHYDSKFKGTPAAPLKWRKESGYPLIVLRSKKSPFQDFQRFAEPARLLPATEPRFLGKNTAGSLLDSTNLDESSSFYLIQLRTSNEFGSSLSDADAAILITFIDVDGDSVLQRIPALSSVSGDLHFQRGSVDVLGFQGPKLGDIDALWVGVESGSWRLSGIRMTVIVGAGESSSDLQYGTRGYDFEADDVLLGESGGLSIAELRPKLVNGSSVDAVTGDLFLESRKPSVSMEESMEEYSDLKLSLLVYDFLCIAVGTFAVAAVPGNEEAAYAFAAGGVCGFFYLLLLQRSVDGMSSSSFPAAGGKFRGSLWRLALTLAAAGAAARFWVGEGGSAVTPVDLFLGLAGFLSCKLAVILAAFKPLKSLGRRE